MNTPTAAPKIEPAWKTYLKTAAFLIPPIAAWGFSAVFLFPKLKEIWREACFQNLTAHRVLDASNFLLAHGLLISAVIVAVLVLLEWRHRAWPRYRRTCVGLAVFLLNSAVLGLITAMLMTALLAAPALLRAR
ncbi:MAG: hypothetical protein HYY24_25180 [Verrucomicrobia bacterium]|nr:hypothetical protein [Verrucomicrobiota bacterium]